MTERRLSPCIDQTREEIESYYRNAPVGSPAAVRHSQYGMVRYTIRTIAGRRPRVGKVEISGAGDFTMKSGKECAAPTGQTRLVVPTEAVIKWSEANPFGVIGVAIYRPEDDPFRTYYGAR